MTLSLLPPSLGITLQSSPGTARGSGGERSRFGLLMKFQVAAWRFPHQGCVGTKQGLLGAPAVPHTCGSAMDTHSLAEVQTPPESKLQKPSSK